MKCKVCFALVAFFLSSSMVTAEELFFSFTDPEEDVWGCPFEPLPCTIQFGDIVEPVTDLVGLDFWFDNVTGEYSVRMTASAAHPFIGDFVLNVNLYNADTGLPDPLDAFLGDQLNYFSLTEPTTEITLEGNSAILFSWNAGDRVGACEGSGGIIPEACDESLGFPNGFAAGIVGFREPGFQTENQSYRDVFSTGPPATIVSAESCSSDADCEDGLFCTENTCDESTGSCAVIPTCTAAIIDCVEYGSCDEDADECLAIPVCELDQVCGPAETCFFPGQDVASEACGLVQEEAQEAVLSGGPYKNHGQLVSTAAQVVSGWVEAGVITEECAGTIMNQFGRDVSIDDQESTGIPINCSTSHVVYKISGTLGCSDFSEWGQGCNAGDLAGLEGATFAVRATLPVDAEPYGPCPGGPCPGYYPNAYFHVETELTITGASIPSSNGVFLSENGTLENMQYPGTIDELSIFAGAPIGFFNDVVFQAYFDTDTWSGFDADSPILAASKLTVPYWRNAPVIAYVVHGFMGPVDDYRVDWESLEKLCIDLP